MQHLRIFCISLTRASAAVCWYNCTDQFFCVGVFRYIDPIKVRRRVWLPARHRWIFPTGTIVMVHMIDARHVSKLFLRPFVTLNASLLCVDKNTHEKIREKVQLYSPFMLTSTIFWRNCAYEDCYGSHCDIHFKLFLSTFRQLSKILFLRIRLAYDRCWLTLLKPRFPIKLRLVSCL